MLSVRVIVFVIRPRQRRCWLTFHFHSITFEGMYWFHSNFVELYITVIIHQILAELRPFFDLFLLFVSVQYLWTDALIHSNFAELYTLYHCKIQVMLDIGNHLPNFGWVMALFRLRFCWCVDIGFWSVTFAGMHWFYWKFAEGYIIVKYRSSSILVIICKILGKLWPFFNLITFRDRSDYKDQCFFPFSYQMVGALSRRHIWFSEI